MELCAMMGINCKEKKGDLLQGDSHTLLLVDVVYILA